MRRSDLLCLVSRVLGLLLEQLLLRSFQGDQLDRQLVDLPGESERRLVVVADGKATVVSEAQRVPVRLPA